MALGRRDLLFDQRPLTRREPDRPRPTTWPRVDQAIERSLI